MSNVTPLPTASLDPINNRRRGRLPSSVTKLTPARAPKAIAGECAPADAYRAYGARRDAALATARESSDARLLEHLENLRSALMHIERQVWDATNALLYRIDPGLEDAGNKKTGQV